MRNNINFEIRMDEIKINNKRLYKCDICGKVGNWDNNWEWFGSYKDQDNGKPLLYICSTECKGDMTKFAATNLLKLKSMEGK